MPETPWDRHLRELLGEHRWDEYATDERRRDVAAQLAGAAADGHDIGALVTAAVNCREWEDDPKSPSRRVGSVLLYRVRGAIASGEFKTVSTDGRLPSGVAQVVARSAAPASSTQDKPRPVRADTVLPDQGPPRSRDTHPQSDRGRG
jgi:hypothetical protein